MKVSTEIVPIEIYAEKPDKEKEFGTVGFRW